MATSRPVVGSSRMMTAGRHANAMAIPIRCCCPPESSCGKRRWYARSFGRPTSVSTSATRASRSRVSRPNSWARSTSAICSPTRSDPLRDSAGSWGTYAIVPPRNRRVSRSESVSRSTAPGWKRDAPACSSTVPRRSSSPARRWFMHASAAVVFPDPDSPTSARIRPGWSRRLTSSRMSSPPTTPTLRWVTVIAVSTVARGTTVRGPTPPRSSARRPAVAGAAPRPVVAEALPRPSVAGALPRPVVFGALRGSLAPSALARAAARALCSERLIGFPSQWCARGPRRRRSRRRRSGWSPP